MTDDGWMELRYHGPGSCVLQTTRSFVIQLRGEWRLRQIAELRLLKRQNRRAIIELVSFASKRMSTHEKGPINQVLSGGSVRRRFSRHDLQCPTRIVH